MCALKHRSRILKTAALLLGIAVATAGWAQTLPRLPEDFALPKGEASPGQVVFRHQTHVDQQNPNCTGCHPGLFKILAKGAPATGEFIIGHSEEAWAGQCGVCHTDGTALDPNNADTCMTCHRESDPE